MGAQEWMMTMSKCSGHDFYVPWLNCYGFQIFSLQSSLHRIEYLFFTTGTDHQW